MGPQSGAERVADAHGHGEPDRDRVDREIVQEDRDAEDDRAGEDERDRVARLLARRRAHAAVVLAVVVPDRQPEEADGHDAGGEHRGLHDVPVGERREEDTARRPG